MVEDVALVASELIGNAVRHASPLPGGELQVSWELRDDGVEVRVTDGGGAARPIPRQVGPQDLSGRGLSIVDRVANDWGVDASANRTTVWARVGVRCHA